MQYYSLNGQSPPLDFKEAAIRGQAPDKGLYFPEHIPVFDSSFFHGIEKMDDREIAYQVIQPYVGESIPGKVLKRVISETINFPIPLVKLSEKIFSLEMFHGPTLAFKDVGARFMSRCFGYFSKERNQKLVVLVATSGDTGGAVANGFYDVNGVEVVILYPSGKVSSVQEKQLTTLGKNIHALEVNGNFDQCQQLVKQAFADVELNANLFLTSANSINVARWLPQQFYYFLAYKQWPDKKHPPVISIPSGNFGNICAAILAHASGLPVQHFIAACNVNDVVPEFLKTGEYRPKTTIATISNAMDVGDPNNFVRILEIFEEDISELKRILSAYSITDDETKTTIKKIYKQYHYVLDPHGAVGYLCLERFLKKDRELKGIFVETAHPVKFYDVVEPLIGAKIPLPPAVENVIDKFKVTTKMDVDYNFLRDFLFQLK
ncbi:MAG: threonine synthase [Bacteroidetes bacterium]|nr:MAG: threonine synthase [Bacteroidota bacterium]